MCYSFISISEFHKVENKQWNPQPQLPKNLGRTWNGLEFFWSCWQTFATWATTTSWSGQSSVQVKSPWLEAPFRKNNFGYYIFSFPANIRVDNSGLLKKKIHPQLFPIQILVFSIVLLRTRKSSDNKNVSDEEEALSGKIRVIGQSSVRENALKYFLVNIFGCLNTSIGFTMLAAVALMPISDLIVLWWVKIELRTDCWNSRIKKIYMGTLLILAHAHGCPLGLKG